MVAKNAFASYNSCLASKPLLTKAITSAIIGILGDLIASYKKGRSFKRTFVFALYGGVVTGPLFHWWYKTLDLVCNKYKMQGKK